MRFARATTSAGIAATIAGSSSKDGQVHRARTCRCGEVLSSTATTDTGAGEIGAVAAHLARKSERLLSDRLRVADVAEHHIRERTRLAFLQCLHVPLSSYKRVTGVRVSDRTNRCKASRIGSYVPIYPRTIALITSWPRTAYSMSLIFGLILSGDSAANALRSTKQPSQFSTPLSALQAAACLCMPKHTCHGGPAAGVQVPSGCVVRRASQRGSQRHVCTDCHARVARRRPLPRTPPTVPHGYRYRAPAGRRTARSPCGGGSTLYESIESRL